MMMMGDFNINITWWTQRYTEVFVYAQRLCSYHNTLGSVTTVMIVFHNFFIKKTSKRCLDPINKRNLHFYASRFLVVVYVSVAK